MRALTPLVAGIADGLVREALIVDGGSIDDARAIAEAAGCRWIEAFRGAPQWIAGANAAKGEWLLFLPAAGMLERGWVEETRALIERGAHRAAIFRLAYADAEPRARRKELVVNLLAGLAQRPRPEQGLLIARALYDALGGFDERARFYEDFIARIGRARLATLRTAIVMA